MRAADPVARPGGLRVAALDTFRGIAIAAVVAIHALDLALRRSHAGDPGWMAAAVANRALQFAVPAFLMLTTALGVRSLRAGVGPSVFVRRRLAPLIGPYVFWFAVCAAYAAHAGPGPFAWHEAAVRFATGRSYYHLYFLGLAVQLVLVLPWLSRLCASARSPGRIAAAAVFATAGVYALNRFALHIEHVGSFLLWYVPSVAAGLAAAAGPGELADRARRSLPLSVGCAGVGAAWYLPLAVQDLAGGTVNTLAYQAGEWAYTTAAAWCLLGVACAIPAECAAARGLRACGLASLQIYLLHPVALLALDRVARAAPGIGAIPVAPVAAAAALAGSVAMARVLAGRRPWRWVLGR